MLDVAWKRLILAGSMRWLGLAGDACLTWEPPILGCLALHGSSSSHTGCRPSRALSWSPATPQDALSTWYCHPSNWFLSGVRACATRKDVPGSMLPSGSGSGFPLRLPRTMLATQKGYTERVRGQASTKLLPPSLAVPQVFDEKKDSTQPQWTTRTVDDR